MPSMYRIEVDYEPDNNTEIVLVVEDSEELAQVRAVEFVSNKRSAAAVVYETKNLGPLHNGFVHSVFAYEDEN